VNFLFSVFRRASAVVGSDPKAVEFWQAYLDFEKEGGTVRQEESRDREERQRGETEERQRGERQRREKRGWKQTRDRNC